MPPVRIAVALVLFALLAGGCGERGVPESEPQPPTSSVSNPLAQLFSEGATPLLRTDFSDDAAWERVVQTVTAPVDFGDEAGGLYEPYIEPFTDRGYEGATGPSLADDLHGERLGYVLLADHRTMREAAAGGEVTVVYMDRSVTPEDAAEFGFVYGCEVRCTVGEVASIEANLSIDNMDFDQFADSVDADGVFRGFSD